MKIKFEKNGGGSYRIIVNKTAVGYLSSFAGEWYFETNTGTWSMNVLAPIVMKLKDLNGRMK